MRLALKVEYHTGESEDVDAVFADFVAFERTWNRSVARFETDLRLTDLAWLAWSQLSASNKTKAKFDPDWIRTVANVTVRDAGESPLAS